MKTHSQRVGTVAVDIYYIRTVLVITQHGWLDECFSGIGNLFSKYSVSLGCMSGRFMELQSQMTSNPTTFAQAGALAALKHPDKSKAALTMMLEAFDRRRKFLYEGLSSIPGIVCPKALGAFYLFPDISSFGLSASEFATRLLKEKDVAVVPGEGFGAPGYIRLSYATSDEVIAKGLERIRSFCATLR